MSNDGQPWKGMYESAERDLLKLREELSARAATDDYNPVRAMLLQAWLNSMIRDLEAGKVEEVIAGLKRGSEALDEQRREQ